MDLLDIHNLLDFYLRKSQAGFLSPEEKDRALNRAQIDYFNRLKPAYGSSQAVNDALKPFYKKSTFTNATSVGGSITLPTDYLHLLVISVQIMDAENRLRYIPVELVNVDELDYRLDSALTPVNVYNPVGVFDESGKFQMYPDSPTAGTIRYLRNPTPCKFTYTATGRTITYDKTNSVQLEWNEPSTNKIILIALETLGVNLQDINTVQFAKEAQNG
jgi:hypothetical protein